MHACTVYTYITSYNARHDLTEELVSACGDTYYYYINLYIYHVSVGIIPANNIYIYIYVQAGNKCTYSE